MVHRFVSGLGSLLLTALDPSAGVGFAATLPAMPSAAEPAMPSAAQPAHASVLELAGGDPQPGDPQCGACAAYVLEEQALYVFFKAVDAVPRVRLDLYSLNNQLVGTYALKPTAGYGIGRIAYAVPGGPTRDVVHRGVMRWNGEQPGVVHQIDVAVRSSWRGWSSLDD
ncbi:hypothetical protein [Sorangium sp. So ce341]|uniref:hypothetical protein n=1 Tax=Sorangium sp. So ce341 TaxID=3133302 RepID=UPI003F5F8C42